MNFIISWTKSPEEALKIILATKTSKIKQIDIINGDKKIIIYIKLLNIS